eukprot:CAMPEP_0184691536 /NCGR_PEP_ID=MMETSP0313-20130426/366_1 /TAXON_ID=2792 /ORGANISM="Porphyridium aerugineum, Strain SAG 1380-2" /LENGTH=634 /DNA_ID=CAMNT_0027149277 /DNA_START=392 /DNA_END=2296 /DNA_ORIENTATION=+
MQRAKVAQKSTESSTTARQALGHTAVTQNQNQNQVQTQYQKTQKYSQDDIRLPPSTSLSTITAQAAAYHSSLLSNPFADKDPEDVAVIDQSTVPAKRASSPAVSSPTVGSSALLSRSLKKSESNAAMGTLTRRKSVPWNPVVWATCWGLDSKVLMKVMPIVCSVLLLVFMLGMDSALALHPSPLENQSHTLSNGNVASQPAGDGALTPKVEVAAVTGLESFPARALIPEIIAVIRKALFDIADLGASRLSIQHVGIIFASLLSSVMLMKKVAPTSFVHQFENGRYMMAVYSVLAGVFTIFVFQQLQFLTDVGALTALRFFQFFCAGGICALITHAACVPIDVVKTRLQTSHENKYSGAMDCLRSIVKEEGPSVLLKGFGATATGYFFHGAFKYSFYEMFKLILIPDARMAALKPPLHVAALAGFLAECVASLLLCPMEAIRIRAVADPTFPNDVISGLVLLFKSEGIDGLYKGLPSILLKQVPYTVGQFVAFEFSVKFVKVVADLMLGGLDHISSTGAALISLSAGILAGVFAGIISQPGDTILSKINQEQSEGSALSQIVKVARNLGFQGLFLGLGTRLLQVSLMIGGQFLIYDTVKMWCGITVASAVTAAATSSMENAAASAPESIAKGNHR